AQQRHLMNLASSGPLPPAGRFPVDVNTTPTLTTATTATPTPGSSSAHLGSHGVDSASTANSGGSMTNLTSTMQKLAGRSLPSLAHMYDQPAVKQQQCQSGMTAAPLASSLSTGVLGAQQYPPASPLPPQQVHLGRASGYFSPLPGAQSLLHPQSARIAGGLVRGSHLHHHGLAPPQAAHHQASGNGAAAASMNNAAGRG
ncbi:hypothetical protein EC988_009411, partial [Linderina pennispora]